MTKPSRAKRKAATATRIGVETRAAAKLANAERYRKRTVVDKVKKRVTKAVDSARETIDDVVDAVEAKVDSVAEGLKAAVKKVTKAGKPKKKAAG
jgi:hypothetical protein